MKIFMRIVAVVAIVIVILIALLALHLRVPAPEREGIIALKGLQDSVEVFFDPYGVPHIYARNNHDLFLAAGYIAASDRLFQMDQVLRAGLGRLSEVFGDELFETDLFLRTFGFYQVAKQVWKSADPETREIVKSYVDGINYYIETHRKNLPIEFRILRYKPLEWTPAAALTFARLMSWQLQQSWWAEILFWRLGEYYSPEKVKEIYPVYLENFPTIVSTGEDFNSLFSELFKIDTRLRQILGSEGHHQGSNNWAISGSKSVTGKPILCNDPHLGYQQPAKWYEMHLVSDQLDVAGVTLAGVPGVIIGRNRYIAWGLTNVMLDDIDFYIETVNPENPDQYLYNGEWQDMEIREEVIKLKSGEEKRIRVRSTVHGPIISDIHPLLKNSKHVVSIRWTGHDISQEARAIYKVNKARNWDEFLAGLRDFRSPAQNFAYADMDGNIGLHPAGAIPIRKDAEMLLPFPGDNPEYDWQGYVPFDEIPYLFNPPKGFAGSANNKTISDDYPYYISNYWEDPSRYMRLEEVLSQDRKFSVEDMKKLQNDHYSHLAAFVTPYFLNAIGKMDFQNQIEEKAYQLLKEWNFQSEAGAIAPAIFNACFIKLAEAIYKDEMDLAGKNFYEAYVTLANIPTRNIRLILQTGKSSWIDNITTKDKQENLTDILQIAFRNAINYLRERYGDNLQDWRWGRIHTLTHKHPFGNNSLLNSIFGFNVGPFERDGDAYTLDNGEISWMNPFENILGPSTRRINSMDDIDNTLSIIPTGQSGRPNSPHYDDQVQLYNKGEYKPLYLSREKVEATAKSKLQLVP